MVDSLWDTSITVLPLLSSLSDFKIIPSFKESKLLVGSSSNLDSLNEGIILKSLKVKEEP